MIYVLIVLAHTTAIRATGFSAEFASKDTCEAAKALVVETWQGMGNGMIRAFCVPK